MNIAYNRDCMEAMREYPDKYFDLAVIDPPYGIGEDGSKNKTRAKQRAMPPGSKLHGGKTLPAAKNYPAFAGNDKNPPPAEFFTELFRISKNQIIFGANHFISRIPFDSSCWIVWDKCNGSNDFADCELAWTSFKTAVRKFEFRWNGMLQGNMKNRENRIHPTQKPVALYSWIYQNYAKPGYKILDTHLGSGSSRIAAYDAGLDFTGFEIHKGYFDLQEARFQQHTAQTNLFLDHADQLSFT